MLAYNVLNVSQSLHTIVFLLGADVHSPSEQSLTFSPP